MKPLPPNTTEYLRAWIALGKTPGVGSRTFNQLLDSFESPEQIFRLIRENDLSVFKQAGIKPKVIDAIKRQSLETATPELSWLDSNEAHHIITLGDEQYPILLREIPDPPAVLYINGDVSLLNDPQLAMVGSRHPSSEAMKTAELFANHLSRQGLCITSGLALGIDGFSHKGALDAGGPTIGVIATGLDRVYPAKHRHLAHRIAEQGALVSEFPLETNIRPSNFPRRNRIISGLSLGTLVVEATLKSGSLITAKSATEQGREVFAIPGSIHNPMARGCHQLIRQGAKLIETSDHILEELSALIDLTDFANRKNDVDSPIKDASDPISDNNQDRSDEYLALLESIGYDPVSVDQIVMKTGLPPDAISSMLLIMELDGKITACGSGLYKQTLLPE